MRDADYSCSIQFLNRFFDGVEGAIELRVLHNENREDFFRKITDGDDARRAILQQRDQPGYGSFFAMATRKPDAKRGTKEDVAFAPALWVDIDCVKEGLKGDDVLSSLSYLPYPPTITVNSGCGIHAYWMLEEPLDLRDDDALKGRLEAALRKLALVLAGDFSCCEVARILRIPGTMNSKPRTVELYGEPEVCTVIEDNGSLHDFDELCEWLEAQRVLLNGKRQDVKPVKESDPFVAYAREAGYNPAIDIHVELDAMEHGAGGQNSIHLTQLRVSASMIARDYDDEEIVALILAATERAAPRDRPWNWSREERSIRDMIRTGRAKGYKKEEPGPSAKPAPVAQSDGNAALNTVVDLNQEREKRHPKPEPKAREKIDEITLLGGAVLKTWQDRYGPVLHSRGTSYAYEAGVWSVWDEQHDQMLRAMLQEACASLGLPPKSQLLNSAATYFMYRPSLLERDVEFDQHPLIVCGDGTVDPKSGEIGEHSPDMRAQFKVGANLQGPRECKAFLKFLGDSFTDKADEEIPDIIRTLQEWFGACLVANKSRSLAKGMLVYGGSRTGKTQLSEVLRALLGRSQTSAAAAGDIGTDFGLQGFLGKRGWIADDAIGQDEFLDAERYKKIVTGEEIGVRRKNKTDVMARFGFPVMLTANHLPKVKDQSDAVYNRSLVLPMTRVRSEHLPEPAGYSSIAAKIVAEELTGVLWWAIEGWQRLSARGVFTEPPCMKKANDELQNSNNSLRAWMKESVEADPKTKVATADLFASFAGWYYQENGSGKFPWSQNGFTRKIKAAMPNLDSQAGIKARALIGIRLTPDGLEYWSINSQRDHLVKVETGTLDQAYVNQEYSVSHADRAKGIDPEQRVTPLNKEPRF